MRIERVFSRTETDHPYRICMGRNGETCICFSLFRLQFQMIPTQHVCVTLAPWNVPYVRDDCLQCLPVVSVAEKKRNGIETQSELARLRQQPNGARRSFPAGILNCLPHGHGQRLRRRPMEVLATILGTRAAQSKPGPIPVCRTQEVRPDRARRNSPDTRTCVARARSRTWVTRPLKTPLIIAASNGRKDVAATGLRQGV